MCRADVSLGSIKVAEEPGLVVTPADTCRPQASVSSCIIPATGTNPGRAGLCPPPFSPSDNMRETRRICGIAPSGPREIQKNHEHQPLRCGRVTCRRSDAPCASEKISAPLSSPHPRLRCGWVSRCPNRCFQHPPTSNRKEEGVCDGRHSCGGRECTPVPGSCWSTLVPTRSCYAPPQT